MCARFALIKLLKKLHQKICGVNVLVVAAKVARRGMCHDTLAKKKCYSTHLCTWKAGP